MKFGFHKLNLHRVKLQSSCRSAETTILYYIYASTTSKKKVEKPVPEQRKNYKSHFAPISAKEKGMRLKVMTART